MPVLTQTVFDVNDYPDLGSVPRQGGAWLPKTLATPPSPARTRRIADRCRGVAARLPISDGSAPPAVLSAHTQFIDCVTQAEGAADALESAQAAVGAALRTDVGHASTLKKGAALLAGALKRPAARDAEEVAEVACLASEGNALQALQELLEVTREHWQDWRVALAREAGAAIDEAVVAFTVAEAAIVKRGEALEALNTLDHVVATRFTAEWEQTGRTVEYSGVGTVVLPDHPHPRAAHSYLGMGAEIEALRAALATVYPWAPPATPPAEVPEMVEYGIGDLVGVKKARDRQP